MLKLLGGENPVIIDTDDFYIDQKSSGVDELVFNLSLYDENYPAIMEEAVIEYEQPYVIKAIDSGSDKAKVKCQLDLDSLKETLNPKFTNGSDTLANTVDSVLPPGWIYVDNSFSTIRRTIEGAYTPYDVIMACAETYDVAFRFDVKHKRITSYDLKSFQPLGAFASRDLNLKEINYKGKSTDFYTRLYAYGKNDLTFAEINDGKPYVENFQYTDKIICAYWKDERYEDPESLLENAQKAVDTASIPERSYQCTIIDLAKTNPEMYSSQDFSIFTVVKLIDDIKNVSVNYQVVEYRDYPYYPEKNAVTLSTATPKIQNTVKEIKQNIEDKNSTFWKTMNVAITSATDWITGVNGGYVVLHKNEEGIPYEILIMDAPDIETAKNVWRWNQNGFGHSDNGYNGPYTTAITTDGQIVADFILAGTMMADRIKGGTLTLGGKENGNGVAKILDSEGKVLATIDKNGVTVDKEGEGGLRIEYGRIYIRNENGVTRGIIFYQDNGISIQSYGGSNSMITLTNDGKVLLSGKSGSINIPASGAMQINATGGLQMTGKTTKSGRVEFSDGTYLELQNGVVVGGNTKEGTF